MAKAISMAAQEKRWQQENDARTLAEAEQIKKDPARVKGAATAAQKMQKEHQQSANALKTIANKAPKSAPKITAKQGQKKK